MLQLGSINTAELPSFEFGEYETTFSKYGTRVSRRAVSCRWPAGRKISEGGDEPI
jgi:hypothetical protein